FGTRLGGGCTSGHGICGIGRLSVNSMVATATFVAIGVLTVFTLQQFGIYL
ncbi:MAG: YeeE/YedE family protein, partial [Candidatus Thioglobus sp.]|nr:YeeE/YedE family protein [Candidatus Thioglobus sp.]